MMHSVSRAPYEEVTFDTEKVTSVDWNSLPTLRHTDTPERIDVVLVNGDPNENRPDLPHYGAGEAACKPLLAFTANAIYDATGVHVGRVPSRPRAAREFLPVRSIDNGKDDRTVALHILQDSNLVRNMQVCCVQRVAEMVLSARD